MKNFFRKNKYLFLTFVISFIIMAFAFIRVKIFPFGERQIMIVDSWHQYFPFLNELHSKLLTKSSLFYSFNQGLGVNFLLIMAYYAFSPIYLLSIFFPKEYLREFLVLATIIKISLAGTFFSLYIKKIFKKEDISIFLFGIIYAFSGYTMGYYWNIMWLDGMMLLPLIILGLDNLIEEKGFLLYIISLSLALISNFYIGFFICLFIFIDFFVKYFTKYQKEEAHHLINKIFRIGVFTLMSLGLSAIVLIPTYKGLSLTHALSSTSSKVFKAYYPILDIINNLLLYIKPSVRNGLPNIYSGLFTLFLVILYFSIKSIPKKSKAINIGFLIFLILSFNINYLDYIWHGFHFPNEVPHRFAFIFSFLFITIGYEAFIKLEEVSIKTIGLVTGIFVTYLIFCEKIYNESLDFQIIYINILFITLYFLSIYLLKSDIKKEKIFIVLISALIISEGVLSATNSTITVGTSDRKSYPSENEKVQKALSEIGELDKDFYRIEMTKWYTTNDPALYGYRGVSLFSSTANSNVSLLAQKLGLSASQASNRYLYSSSTPIINGMFSIKYLIDRNNQANTPNGGFELEKSEDGFNIYKNKYPLSLGFMVSNSLNNWDINKTNPFEVQESFFNLGSNTNEKIFENIPLTDEKYTNISSVVLEGIRYKYNNTDSNKVGKASLIFEAPETKQMYIYLFTSQAYNAKVNYKGKTLEYDTRRGQIIDLGIMEKNEEIEINFEVFAAKDGYFNLQLVSLNEDAFAKGYEKLRSQELKIKNFTERKIEGEIDVEEEGNLYLSIPYEKGWEVKVDGQPSQLIPLKNALMILPLQEGKHTIELFYTPDGFKLGAGISLVSLILIIGTFIFYKLSKRKDR